MKEVPPGPWEGGQHLQQAGKEGCGTELPQCRSSNSGCLSFALCITQDAHMVQGATSSANICNNNDGPHHIGPLSEACLPAVRHIPQ